MGCAAAVGSILMGRAFDSGGSYDVMLMRLAAGTFAVAALMLALPRYDLPVPPVPAGLNRARPPRLPEVAQPELDRIGADRCCDLVDERPLDVVLAQPIRVARPLATWDAIDELSHGVLGAIGRLRGGYRHDAAGLFAFSFGEILLAIDAGHRRDRAV